MKSTPIKAIIAALFVFSQLLSSAQLHAQGGQETHADNRLEELIVTGTRQAARTSFSSLAPIDVVSEADLDATSSEDLLDSITQIVPSFKVQRLPLSDGLIFVRPASLRNLSSDQTLVLVNGKRRHRSAVLGNNGAQAPDMASISSYAIKRVEVLRDGASAQYGSDAIAGVVNVILDDQVGYKAFTQFSEYFEGDGFSQRYGVQGGWNLGSDGFLNATIEYFDSDNTSRSRQRPDALEFQAANPDIELRNPVQNWGQPERDGLRVVWNGNVDINDNLNTYFFGSYGEGEGVSDFNWRNPNSGVFRTSTVFPNFDLAGIYPGGFSPQFGQDDEDLSIVAGIEGALLNDNLTWDFSLGYGSNEVDYFIFNTINASLGPNSPTSFRPGTLEQDEFNINLDFVYQLAVGGLSDNVNVAFGLEQRTETYTVTAGDEASYIVGPAAAEGLPSGSNGFFGFSPIQAGEFDQDSFAAYVDLEIPVTERFSLGLAGRYEDFSEFGDTFNTKVSARYEITNGFALRATTSTGFRAPTPGQLFSERNAQGLDTETLEVFTRGRFSPEGAIAGIVNARPDVNIESLRPEESDNYSIGLVYQNDSGLSATVDIYKIDIEDRFGTSQNFSLTDSERSQLVALGVTGAESITSVNFYQNDFQTETQGVDVVVSDDFAVGAGDLRVTLAFNYNETEVTGGSLVNNESARVRFEERVPKTAANLSFNYNIGDFDIMSRLRYYGSWTDRSDNSTGDIFQEFGSETFVDFSLTYNFNDSYKVRIGAENIFNNYPEEATFQANRGLIYSRNAPYDTDGGNYYIRFDANFN